MRNCFAAFVVVTVSLAVAPTAWAQPTLVKDFTGVSLSDLPGLNSGFGFIPPDTMGAIGATQFAEFTNGSFTVYDKTTGGPVGSPESLTAFWQNAGITGLSIPGGGGAGTTDPHVLFDPVSQHWFAVTITDGQTPNRILVGVSNTADATGTWKGFAIGNLSSPGTFADFPTVGIDRNGLFVSLNNFNGGSAASEGVLVIPKAALIGGSVAGATQFTNIPISSTGFTPAPIVDYDNAATSHLLVSSFNSTSLVFSTINNTTTSPTLSPATRTDTVAGNVNTIFASQSGGPNNIDAGDTRFGTSVVKQDGFLWAVNTNTIAGREALVIYRFDATTGALLETKTIGDSTHDYFYGSIAVTQNGDMIISYTRSGPTEFAGSFATWGHFDGTSMTLNTGSQFTLHAGTGSYNVQFGGGRNRWGDYSQTTIDPNDPNTIWTVQEWASGDSPFGAGNPGNWHTQIAEFTFPQSTPTIPEPSSLVLSAIGLGLVALKGIRCRRRRSA
ncbi:MAG TPA: PEP-CTERM sorting domain-containing protein [Isosphaeraceae bacterium]|nr:PEP-CTERM sorting domain-containing protein [Isosphaeraceae bacterium]